MRPLILLISIISLSIASCKKDDLSDKSSRAFIVTQRATCSSTIGNPNSRISEISNLNKKLENSESKILDIKLSKQIFKVRYIYLTMAMEGVLIMKKDELDNEYYFIIENVLTTRKYSFLNVDLIRDFVDDTKIYIFETHRNKKYLLTPIF